MCTIPVFQGGYCSPLNILIKGNYQKRKKCAVQDQCDSNSQGGHKPHSIFNFLYPEWPRTCTSMVWHFEGRTFAANSVQQVLWFAAQPALQCAIRGAQGVLPCVGWGGATSQLDLPSLTPLSVAGCGWLQLGAPHLDTSVNLLRVVDNWTHIQW